MPINVFSKQLRSLPSIESMSGDYQHGTMGEMAETEHSANTLSKPPKKALSTTPSKNDSDSSPAVTVSAEHHLDISLEAEHEESAPKTQDQLSLQNTLVNGIRDDIENGRSSSELGMSMPPITTTDAVDQSSIQNGACINLRGNYISEDLVHNLMLAHTDSSPATGNISDNSTSTHASMENAMPYEREHIASPLTPLDDSVTESNILSSCSTKQSVTTPGNGSPPANVSTMPSSNSPCTLTSVGVSQTLAEDNILAMTETVHGDTFACLPDSPAVLSSPPTHTEISSLSGYIHLPDSLYPLQGRY